MQPCVRVFASAHAPSQPPQCSGSIAVSAQKRDAPAPQVVAGSPQLAPHTPPEHTWPAAQAVPHAPQWASLLCVSTQAPEQFV